MSTFTVEAQPPSTPTLDIRFGGDYTELYLVGQPLGLTWSYNDGSIWDGLIRFAHPDGERHLAEWRIALSTGNAESAIERIAHRFLAPGTYRIVSTIHYAWPLNLPEASTDPDAFSHSYGGDGIIVTTFPPDALSEERVAYYEALIRQGERPCGIALACQDDFAYEDVSHSIFLLDGHHKLKAYERLSILPHLWVIIRLDPPPPSQPYPARFADRRFMAASPPIKQKPDLAAYRQALAASLLHPRTRERDPRLCRRFVELGRAFFTRHPHLKHCWAIDEDEHHCVLVITGTGSPGFDVTMDVDWEGICFYADGYRCYRPVTKTVEDFLLLFFRFLYDLLSPAMRIREHLAAGHPIRWDLERNKAGQWVEEGLHFLTPGWFGRHSEKIYMNTDLPARG